MLQNKNIVLGIASSISAYKDLELIKILKQKGANVDVLMSKNATHLVDPEEFEKASGNPVSFEQFAPGMDFRDYLKNDKEMKHISLADKADIILLCPCTANTIGKIANGIADTLICSTVMATQAPVIICPAMNVKMWYNQAMQENVSKLKKIGYEFVNPEKGVLACGYHGIGRLATFDKVIEKTESVLGKRNDLKGKKILVTAGATIEDIDPVRVITNKSSGKQGVYLAEEAAKRGAEVTLIRGKDSVEPMFFGIKDITIYSVKDLFDKIKENLNNDVIVHAAAVSDFKLNNKINEKIKSSQDLHLELTPTTKIFEKIKNINKNIFLVGFKAEYNVTEEELIKRSYSLLKSADADLIVANDIGNANAGFDVETNKVIIVDKEKNINNLKLADKRIIGNKVLDEIKKRL
ncbi:bifunctional phosphopantothenoylcysteine decarboxylase/phosphopantothenate--cysteine ligase CoaBC [Candidatus Woesearchaeota archaeon]|nr:bifunctional phosphopantothenoylcysteine decarboxylase/phosphopantothenate--cysteine ligase CoaBC [Candidatus Woesearchaeota archaeon]